MNVKSEPVEDVLIFGVKIDTLNSDPETAVTYTDDAIGFTPLRVVDGVANWGSWADKYPFTENVPVVVKDGVEQYELNPNDFIKKKDGSASVLTGADGDVFSRFSKLWWKFERVGTDLFVKIATAPVDGFKCLAHTKSGVEKEYVYIGSYMGFSEGGKLRSLSGKIATAVQTIGAFRAQAQANGEGYSQFPYYPLLMVQIMNLIATKSRDSQSAIGRGYVDGNAKKVVTGGTDAKGMVYGEMTGKLQMKLFGIEDFWGNLYQFIDGLFCGESRNILIGDNGFNDTGAGYENYGQGVTDDIGGYLSDVQGGTETGFIAKTVTDLETNHYGDYCSLFAGLLPSFGGSHSSESGAGTFSLDVSNLPSDSYGNYSARCCLVK
ncbi:hypothetical protein FQ087_06025 [Sporosarcina sp. ANT_H38]|uniref:hypothetical protein n=1 Tax=Sporosarcina sp. ANT_H38 TaxID=2597358 RepID=UPI0011F0AE29|nr:hypothetical protein [Sporosarcina sp. ANT_H38]KAA0965822.1 hypothetical protein FQ087_06025 [Sporosarcina sp. ANT_H38]